MGNVDKWEVIVILINEILGKVMWIKMGINAGEMGGVSFRLYKVRRKNKNSGVWMKLIPRKP